MGVHDPIQSTKSIYIIASLTGQSSRSLTYDGLWCRGERTVARARAKARYERGGACKILARGTSPDSAKTEAVARPGRRRGGQLAPPVEGSVTQAADQGAHGGALMERTTLASFRS